MKSFINKWSESIKSITTNGVALIARQAVSAAFSRSTVNRAIVATLESSGRVAGKAALKKLRKCIREKNKCGLKANILIVGYDTPNVRDNVDMGQARRPRNIVLSYKNPARGDRRWYARRGRLGGCKQSLKPSVFHSCDEYPMFATFQGGPNKTGVSLSWVPARESSVVGGHFSVLAKRMGNKDNFIVVTSTQLPSIGLPFGKRKGKGK